MIKIYYDPVTGAVIAQAGRKQSMEGVYIEYNDYININDWRVNVDTKEVIYDPQPINSFTG